ncbi:alkane 1-monooxygenase [Parasedimentitalea huanghaiensis]|uniref:Alkane 1-monooxygenase n=1 Tax=Parasedimentitalea huanghaiensis TaxID=2682100 RepID=A0A6L6WGQ5_9RHOB|nr:alkane 1-monooxygenase [Zongyanglinia huanghaiensis]MVO16448.1 alkane 1-monooxygenase [Zongyanglinia huanghaiensis]
MTTSNTLARWQSALPFWMSFALLPLVWIGAVYGGWTVFLAPLVTWYLFAALDGVFGLNLDNADPLTSEDELVWYTALTSVWVPLQFVTLYGLIWYVTRASHLTGLEKFGVFFGMGVLTGTVGINYSHELMHQKNRVERWLADILLSMVLYSHFRSEHLLVHHRFVGTPRDPVTARYNEGFLRFYPRVLKQSWHSSFRAEQEMLARKDLPWSDLSNPFFRYWGLQAVMLLLAMLLGGWGGLVLFLVQAGVAIWQLELVNYVEHYGLTRKHLGDGKYEHVQPRHSWNASQKASNWLLINLQRHSDHHYKPNRRFPLLQHHAEGDAPQLPYGYPVMTVAAMIPPLWRRVMNPRVRGWRQKYYPEITNWASYNKSSNPMPK